MILGSRLKSELIQLLAQADREGQTEARGFLLDALAPQSTTPQISSLLQSKIDQAILQVYDGPFGTGGGSKISAIKMHRTLTSAGLKESKDYVEALIAARERERPGANGW